MVKDLTKGSPMKLILGFAVPLLFGFLFQQFYNAFDSWVVGRFLGDTALAAVSSCTFLTRMMIGLFVGISATGLRASSAH